MPTDQPTRCQGTNQAGSKCSAAHWKDGWCRWHHPEEAEYRREISARGGKARSNSARARKKLSGSLQDMVGLKAMLLESMDATKNGDMEPGVLTALATAARAVVTVAQVADFEQQLIEMRADMALFAEKQGQSA